MQEWVRGLLLEFNKQINFSNNFICKISPQLLRQLTMSVHEGLVQCLTQTKKCPHANQDATHPLGWKVLNESSFHDIINIENVEHYGTEAEIQLPLKRSSRFQRLFPNPSWLVWGRASRHQKLAPTFPGIDSCLMVTKRDFSKWKRHYD